MADGRRLFIARLAGSAVALLPLQGVWLTGCGPAAARDGPVAIDWDRESCTECGMLISDRVFATEARGGPARELHKFDDIGCAIRWLEGRSGYAAASTRLWIIDPADPPKARWLPAESVSFRHRRGSPMGYDFAPTRDGGAGAVSYAELHRLLRPQETSHG